MSCVVIGVYETVITVVVVIVVRICRIEQRVH